MKRYRGKITEIKPYHIFVFGSNTQGRHGKGSALFARKKAGAIYGQAVGLQGNSYAIVTKDLTKYKHPSISKDYILEQIEELYMFAETENKYDFLIAYSGIGENLNGFSNDEMAKMFASYKIPKNIVFEEYFYNLINKHYELG